MVCQNCGKEVLETEKFCTHCGEPNVDAKNDGDQPIVEKRIIYEYHNRRSTGNVFIVVGILGIIFGILLPIVTYCVSIPGLVLSAKRTDKKGLVLNIIALIIAIINSVLGVILQLNDITL